MSLPIIQYTTVSDFTEVWSDHGSGATTMWGSLAPICLGHRAQHSWATLQREITIRLKQQSQL
jgi:predicted oxidoreductase (fatty acid repression mutant protein)